jgi:uncharacterized protein YqjF (DUF2071 family)
MREERHCEGPAGYLRGVTWIANALDLLASPVAHERVTRTRAHRPWPLPERSWTMAQTWTDLLFAHWGVAPESLRSVLPPQLPLDTFDGQAWIGVTPFGVRNLRLRPAPAVPCLSAFPEINVRTYVTVGGKPGIYFFSLDAGSSLAVRAARRAYRLPYFRAQMSIVRDEDDIRFTSRRTRQDAPARAEFCGRYRPVGDTFAPRIGSLDHWLTERYCLYTFDEQYRILRAEIHHPPWPLQRAQADIDVNTMTAEIAMDLRGEPLLHYARRQDVVFWTLQPCADDGIVARPAAQAEQHQ